MLAEAGDEPLSAPAELPGETRDAHASVRGPQPLVRPGDFGVRRRRVGEPGREGRLEHGETSRPLGNLLQLLHEQQRAPPEQVLERHDPARERVHRDAEERACGVRRQVDLQPVRDAVVLRQHLPLAHTAGERRVAAAGRGRVERVADPPARVEAEDDDHALARPLAPPHRRARLLAVAVARGDEAAQRRGRLAPNEPERLHARQRRRFVRIGASRGAASLPSSEPRRGT